jgi:hypothetical protein
MRIRSRLRQGTLVLVRQPVKPQSPQPKDEAA